MAQPATEFREKVRQLYRELTPAARAASLGVLSCSTSSVSRVAARNGGRRDRCTEDRRPSGLPVPLMRRVALQRGGWRPGRDEIGVSALRGSGRVARFADGPLSGRRLQPSWPTVSGGSGAEAEPALQCRVARTAHRQALASQRAALSPKVMGRPAAAASGSPRPVTPSRLNGYRSCGSCLRTAGWSEATSCFGMSLCDCRRA